MNETREQINLKEKKWDENFLVKQLFNKKKKECKDMQKISSIPVLPCKYETLPSSTQDDNNDDDEKEEEGWRIRRNVRV